MSEGCNLIFTEKDLQQVEKSIAVGKYADGGKTARNILNGKLRNNVDDLIKILSNPTDIVGLPDDGRYKIVKELLIDSLGRGKVYSEQENKLPSALKTLLKFQKKPYGLFEAPPKHRGPGAESMKHPYELLSTSAIIQKGKQGVQTSLGTKLRINPETDTIGFGHKLPAKYALQTKKLGTIEADTIIARKSGFDLKMIGIDAKFTKSGSYSSTSHLTRQLNGIENCFRDGNLQEFYFVTNKQFSPKFKEMVEQKNIEVFEERMKKDATMYRDFGKHLSDEEKKSYIPGKINDLDFKEKPSVLNKLSEKYNVPQIGICEKVNYKQT